jgi:hypothetical protein
VATSFKKTVKTVVKLAEKPSLISLETDLYGMKLGCDQILQEFGTQYSFLF